MFALLVTRSTLVSKKMLRLVVVLIVSTSVLAHVLLSKHYLVCYIKKVCRSRHAFFYVCLFFILSCFKPPAFASSLTSCSVSPQQLLQFEAVKPHTLKDGDSLTLDDGREIRLIGINTPEIFKKSLGYVNPWHKKQNSHYKTY